MIKSLSQLESVIDLCSRCNNWTIQLLNIKNTVKNGTTYIGREIVLHPDDKLNDFLKEIDTYYVKEKNVMAAGCNDGCINGNGLCAGCCRGEHVRRNDSLAELQAGGR